MFKYLLLICISLFHYCHPAASHPFATASNIVKRTTDLEKLRSLEQCLATQETAIQHSLNLTTISDGIEGLKKEGDARIKAFFGGTADQKAIGLQDFKTLEGVAFFLRYASTITKNNTYEGLEGIVDQWRHTHNAEVKSSLEILSLKLQAKQLNKQREDEIHGIAQSFEKMKKIQEPSTLSVFYSAFNTQGPLQYSQNLKQAFIGWCITKKRKVDTQGSAYSKKSQEEDATFKTKQKEIQKNYQQNQGSIETIKDQVLSRIKTIEARKQRRSKRKGPSRPQRKPSKKAIPQRPKKKSNTHATQDCGARSSSSASSRTTGPCPQIDTQKTTEYQTRAPHDVSSATDAADIMVRVRDEKNKANIVLFKLGNPQKEYTDKNIHYTKTAQGWLDDPEKEMEQQGYNDPNNPKFKYRNTAKEVHGFTPQADQYLDICATKSTIKNKRCGDKIDTLLTMPGAIIQDDGTKTLGLFVYIIDSETHTCYHRNFVKRTGKELIENYYQKGFYDVEFPELN